MSHRLVLSHLGWLQTLPLVLDASLCPCQPDYLVHQVSGLSNMSRAGTRRKQGPSICLGLARQRRLLK